MKLCKYICSLVALLVAANHLHAQTYGNEWIDFSKTYYKFKTDAEGIYRIPKTVLDAAGIPTSTNGTQFLLFREGVEVPIFVTTNGAFGNNDYIEFWAERMNGQTDTDLYPSASMQADSRISLFSDSATYFLTYDNQTNHLRYTNVANNIPPSPPAAQVYCFATTGNYYLDQFMHGRHLTGYNEQIFFSVFDNGEGFTEGSRNANVQNNLTLNTPNIVAGIPGAVNINVLRNGYETQLMNMKIYLNNQLIADSTIQADVTKQFNLTVNSSLLSSNNNFQFTPTAPGSNLDEYGISFIEARYARDFNVSGLSYFSFELPAGASQYLEFNNFNHGGLSPRLYDLTNKKWYSGDISVTGKTRFYINTVLNDTRFVLYAANSSLIHNFSTSNTVHFTDYSLPANQGDYIIITHNNYRAITNGHDYIQDYKDYRSSAAGGGRKVIIADVTELYDQYAYGITTHPLSIRHFLQYAYNHWSPKPHDVFLVGKGIYYNKYRTYLQNPSLYNYSALVPTYGEPGADEDFVNFLANNHQSMNIARLSAWNPTEIGNYLDKIKTYEANLNNPISPTYETELWKKRALHAAGGFSAGEQLSFINTLNSGGNILKDTSFGGIVTTVAKNTTVPVDPSGNAAVDSLINNGLSFICYHGHSSPNGFQFNLNTPEQYTNVGKLPHFLGLGCDVAQIFSLATIKTISERYVLANAASATMIASNNPQFASFHSTYLPVFYTSVSRRNYGGTIGDHHHFAYDSIRTVNNTEFTYMHLESMLLQGDPAVKVFGPSLPDYHIAADRLSTIPANVTTSQDTFTLKIVAFNLAKAIDDTVSLKVEHINPGNVTSTIGAYKVINLYNTDTLYVSVPINKVADLGLNKYRVTIDDVNAFAETSETNNTATLEIFIYSDNLVPVYPYEFAIVHQQGVTLKASTLNPFRSVGNYKIEIDTTELFNSNLKQQTTVTSAGGVIKWTPPVTLQDSTVYYWRTAFDSTVNGTYQWTYSSFIYLQNGSDGWNQSHYFQYLKDNFDSLRYNSDRIFRYPTGFNTITVSNAVYSEDNSTPWNTADFMKVMVNGSDVQRLGCQPWGGTIQVMVFDSATNALWVNGPGGVSGSYSQCVNNSRNVYAFEFPVYNAQLREVARHFIDSIPNGHFVLVRNIINNGAYIPSYVDEWQTDGPVSLYHTLHDMGFTTIDSFKFKRVFTFLRKKNDNTFPVYQYITHDSLDNFVYDIDLPSLRSKGNLRSTVIGPAKAWTSLKWKVSAFDNLIANDSPSVKIIGITSNNMETLLYDGLAMDTSLSFIDASTYPRIRLQWMSYDTINYSSPQLDYWRVLYTPVPEAALNPASGFAFSDTLQAGQDMNFSVTVENLTEWPMDSMLVRYKVIDANNVTHTLASKRYKKLPGNDTLHASYSFDPSTYPGSNVFFVEANPDNDQPEQYHPNNLGYLPFTINTDQRNPLIDVTFDGVHILDKDIVSAKPFIKIVLRDENQYLKLDDTSLLTVKLRYPSDISTTHTIPFDGTICRFIPASGNKNEATIELRSSFTEDGTYQLFVNGKDKSGNPAGKSDYQVSFQVINKSTITHVLNYPNPFSTSTAFVFTLTGSQLPTQFKIQILTVTGKVVREITKQELGPIHIGRNITEYKWDGKDQYGQMLGNGVYLYRVVTAINGNDIEHREDMDLTDGNGSVDKFFKNGYGKMYIMR